MMQSSSLEDKVIVVTGGAGTIGNSFVNGIAKNGGTAIVADLNLDSAKAISREIVSKGNGYAEAAYLDITNTDSISSLINDLISRFGHIDAVVNNAYPRNQNYGSKLECVTYSNFCENVSLHLGGYFLVGQQFCIAFKNQGHGNLINVSSIYGSTVPRFGIYDGTQMTMPIEYAAIKAAIEHMTRYFAQYFKGAGIRVNSLSPGGVYTDQPAIFLAAYKKYCASKGMLNPDDLQGALIFLLSDQSEFINGQNLIIDDGFSL